MSATRSASGTRRWIGVALAALPLAHAGCTSPTRPTPPPGGGSQTTLSFTVFEQKIEPILMRQGCDAEGDCHGGGIRGTFELSPPGAKDAQFDFNQAVLQVSVSDPAHSPILMKPLAQSAGGSPHAYEPFASTADTDYVAIRTWIMSGLTP